jgi:predicted glutamine amidotransferase
LLSFLDLHNILINHMHRNHQVNGDGCGIGWYSTCSSGNRARSTSLNGSSQSSASLDKKKLTPCMVHCRLHIVRSWHKRKIFLIYYFLGVFTTISPAWSNRNLNRLAEKVESKLFFGHVRYVQKTHGVMIVCHLI